MHLSTDSHYDRRIDTDVKTDNMIGRYTNGQLHEKTCTHEWNKQLNVLISERVARMNVGKGERVDKSVAKRVYE